VNKIRMDLHPYSYDLFLKAVSGIKSTKDWRIFEKWKRFAK
jgi:hypothetical protein